MKKIEVATAQSIVEDHTDLIHGHDMIDAINEKFARGRKKYGGEWHGHRPIVEAHEEALDLGAYLFREQERGDIDEMLLHELVMQTLNLIQGIRTAIKSVRG